MLGQTLSHYQLVERIGSGGMGEVYRAEDTMLKRSVALKVLPPHLAGSRERLQRFRREAETLAALNHPNIITIHSVEEARGVHFLTMELVQGRSLSELIPERGLALHRIFDIAVPLADALAAAHDRGVIHRDLKPGNIMLTHDGRVKVLDFGLAKQESESSARDSAELRTEPLTGEGQILGTLPYMSPEQLEGKAVDIRSDVYSLGVVLFELATGERPFRGDSAASLVSAILRDQPPEIDAVRTGLPHHLSRIVGHCLEKDPRDRLQSALDVRNELRALRREIDSGLETRPRGRAPLGVRGRSAARGRRFWLAGALALLALAAGLGLALRFLPAAGGPPEPAPVAAPGADAPSVAVLPFTDLSPARDHGYFTDGLTDELASSLARLPGLRVAGRTSAFQFRDRQTDLREIGARLRVSTLLEGSVRKSGNRVRISTQLVNAADGFELWSQTYERELADIFAVQDDIARSVAAALEVTLLTDTGRRQPGDSAEAYSAYLLGRYFALRRNEENLRKAVEYFGQALDLDPDFAPAWTGLAEARAWQAGFGWVPGDEGWSEARAAADRALELDAGLAETWAVRGLIHTWHDWDWAAAEDAFERALALKPGDSEVLRRAASLEVTLGRTDRAIEFARRAVEIDPLNMSAYHSLGGYLYYAGRVEEAEEALTRSLELSRDQPATHLLLAHVLIARGRPEAALAEARLEADPGLRLYGLVLAYTALDRRRQAAAALQELIDGHGDVAAYQIAGAYAFMGEADRSFDWLERAYAQRDGGLIELKADPLLVALRRDPRWPALLERLGLPVR